MFSIKIRTPDGKILTPKLSGMGGTLWLATCGSIQVLLNTEKTTLHVTVVTAYDIEGYELLHENKLITPLKKQILNKTFKVKLEPVVKPPFIPSKIFVAERKIPCSIIIPSYNMRDLLQKTLTALIPQISGQDEVIVIDDGSNDGTEEMLKQEFPRVKCFRQKREGPRLQRARNIGIKAAKNDCVILLDADCIPLPEFVKAHKHSFGPNVVVTGKIFREDKEKQVNDEHPDWGQQRFLKENELNQIRCGNLCFSRSSILKIDGFAEDYDGTWGIMDGLDFASKVTYLLGGKIQANSQARVIHKYHLALREKKDADRNRLIFQRNLKEYKKRGHKIKILYVIEWSLLGGAGIVLKRILDNIDRNLYETDVCVMGKIGDLHKAFGSKSKVYSLKDSKNKYEDLKKIIVEGNYSFVQMYTMMEFLNLAKEVKGPKFICQLNLPLREMRQNDPLWNKWFQSLQQTKPFFHAMVSDSSQQLAIEDMQFIRNGVDLSKFKREKKDPKLVVWIGRMLRVKGPTVIFDIAREMPDYKFVMVVGFEWKYPKGWSEYQNWLDNAVKNKPKNVEIKQCLSEDEVAELLGKASFYILSSISESSPITITEAMACGCVVLSTNVGDASNMIQHGIDGFIIPHIALVDWWYAREKEKIQYHLSEASKKLDAEIKNYVIDQIPKINVAEVSAKARESVQQLTIQNMVKRYEFLYGNRKRDENRIAFVWAYPDLEFRFWNNKIDSMQYTISKLSDEHSVILFVPRPEGEIRERAIINGCNIVFYPYANPKILLPLIRDFDPHILFLNSLHTLVNREIVAAFPNRYKTIYEYGANLNDPVLKKVDTFFVQQKFRVKEAIQNGIPSEKIIVNTHCVDITIFKPTHAEKIYNAVMVADFRSIKRQEILINAWKDMPGNLLLIARLNQPSPFGDYERHCRKLISDLGLKNRVIIHDFVPNKDLPKLLNQCKMGIFTSVREGGSRAMLEIMACGLPMIVLNDSKGCIEMIESGIDGLVTSAANLAATICSLLTNPTKLKNMGVAAATRIHREYPYPKMFEIFKAEIAKAKPKPEISIPEISIITTNLNRGQYLEDCIKSVMAQSKQFKINHIVMDGGSTDGSLDILKKYSAHIRYVHGSDKGQRDAINNAYDIINREFPNTEFVGWINSDDFYQPNWLTESYATLMSQPHNVAMTCSNYNEFNMIAKEKIWPWFETEWIEIEHLLKGNFVCQPSVLMRKHVLDKLKTKYGWLLNPEYDFTIDYELWARILKEGYKIKKINQTLTNLRHHPLQMGRNNPIGCRNDLLKVQKDLQLFFQKIETVIKI